MSELRWALLIGGALFLIALFLWERRKRGAPPSRPAALREPSLGDATLRDTPEGDARDETGADRDPDFTLPELRRREPERALPMIEIPDDGRYPEFGSPPDVARGPSADASHGGSPGATAADYEWPEEGAQPGAREAAAHASQPGEESWAPASSPGATVAPAGAAPSAGAAAGDGAATIRAPYPEPPHPPDPGELRLDWPDESIRQIIAVRVVPLGERFLGRTVRQALSGEGFVHGPLGIFHRALHDGRIVLSAASLTKPGSFDLAAMDPQRYAGLNLFGVLPGPLPGAQALEDLVTCSRALAARLGGQVLDDHGEPLTAARVAEIRASLSPASAGLRAGAQERAP